MSLIVNNLHEFLIFTLKAEQSPKHSIALFRTHKIACLCYLANIFGYFLLFLEPRTIVFLYRQGMLISTTQVYIK